MDHILVDTSVWINFLRNGDKYLEDILNRGLCFCHPFIIGELACGHLSNRQKILSLLNELPSATVVEHDEALHFIDRHKLMGKGLGYIDIHLLASAMLTGVKLWTLDKNLVKMAEQLYLHYQPVNE